MRTALAVFQHLRVKVQSLSTILRFDTLAKKTGRRLAIPIVDILTLALLKQYLGIPTKKRLYELMELETHCTYKTLVVNLNRCAMFAAMAISAIMKDNWDHAHIIKHTDSTSIPVCLNKNARYHKTMQGLSQWGHDGKGFYYGLKLHLTADLLRQILNVMITPANVDDRVAFPILNREITGLIIADAGYISKKLENDFFQESVRRVLPTSY